MRHWNRSSGRYFNPTPPQTIACSAFYEAEVSAKPQYFELQRLSNRYHRTRTGCGTAIDVPGSGPNRVDGNKAQPTVVQEFGKRLQRLRELVSGDRILF